MKANEIIIEEIICDDAGIQEKGHFIIATDCLPSKGDKIILDGIPFECIAKEIRMDHAIAYVTLNLKTSSY